MAGSEPATPQNPIARRYGKAGEASWSHVLNHFALNEGFALVVLVVPDQDASDICSRELARWLGERGKRLVDLSPGDPEGVREAASTLLAQPGAPDLGCVWFGATTAESDEDHYVWRDAWRWGLGTLNQQRNSLREHFDCTVVIAGPPWLVSLFREVAPDLWSIRSIVAWLETDFDLGVSDFLPEIERRDDHLRLMSHRPVGDLNLALREVESLRGVPGKENLLAKMLRRAGAAYIESELFAQAEAVLREGNDCLKRSDDQLEIFSNLILLGSTILLQDRPQEAETHFRQAVRQAEQNDFSPSISTVAKGGLATSLGVQERFSEAEAVLKGLLTDDLNFDDDDESREIVTAWLATAIENQGRYAEAEALLRQALTIYENRGGDILSRGTLVERIGGLMLKQRKFKDAEALLRQELKLKEEEKDSVLSRARIVLALGAALAGDGRLSEAYQVTLQGRALLDEPGEPPQSTESTRLLLGRLQRTLEAIQLRIAKTGTGPVSVPP